MRHLFSTKLRIILVVAVLLSAALAVVAGVTNQTLPGMIVQGILAQASLLQAQSLRSRLLSIKDELMASAGSLSDLAEQID